MRMHVRRDLIAPLLLLAFAFPALAQVDDSEEEEDTGLGTVILEVESWVSQPTGLQFRPGTIASLSNPLGTSLLEMTHGTNDSFRYAAGYEFRDNIGKLLFTYWSHLDRSEASWFSPGLFVLGELGVTSFRAGVFDDGLADATAANSETTTRDIRLDFRREAFRGKRVRGEWLIGYRRIRHDRTFATSYFALAANLPPLIPPFLSSPRPDLSPQPDFSLVSSRFEGRGIEAGLDVVLPIRDRRLWVESGLNLAVLRGKINTSYVSMTHLYALAPDNEIEQILEQPFDEFELCTDGTPLPCSSGNPPLVNSIRQVRAQIGIQSTSDSSSAQVMEAYLGLRWRIWRDLEARAGFRNTRYTNVAAEIRPETVIPDSDKTLDEFSPDGFSLLRLAPGTLERTNRSVDYEGLYFGLSYRY